MSRKQRKNQQDARRRKGKGRRHGDLDEEEDGMDEVDETEPVTKKKKFDDEEETVDEEDE